MLNVTEGDRGASARERCMERTHRLGAEQLLRLAPAAVPGRGAA